MARALAYWLFIMILKAEEGEKRVIFFQLFMQIASELFKLAVAFTDQRIILVPRTQRNKYHNDFYF